MFGVSPLGKISCCKAMHRRPLPDIMLCPLRTRAFWTGILKPDEPSSFGVAVNHGIPELISNYNVRIPVAGDVHGGSGDWCV